VATIDTRLDKVETQLSPQQAVLLWLNEAHQYGSEKAYSETFRDTPFEEYPLYRLPEQMKLAVRGAMKGKKPEAIARAERTTTREVAFLINLVHQFNMRLWGDWRAMCLHLALVAHEMKGLMLDEEGTLAEYEEARQRAIDAVAELFQWQVAIDQVTQRYFGGTNPIFPTYAEMLTQNVELADRVVEMFNAQLDWLTTYAKKNKRGKVELPAQAIDLESLKRELIPAGVDLASHIVAMTKVETARFMGETHEALAMLKARLWPQR
jgi:hypothetical protein